MKETTNMYLSSFAGETKGRINLEKLAIPETMTIKISNERIIPEAFDIFGQPVFSYATYKRVEKKYGSTKLEVEYQEHIFKVPRSEFDSLKGIEIACMNLENLNEMLENRAKFRKAYPKERLNEFMLFGCFHLDVFGQSFSIEKHKFGNMKTSKVAEEFETFCKNNTQFAITTGAFTIPKPNSICEYCKKELTIRDIENNPCIFDKGKFYHDSCWNKKRTKEEIKLLKEEMIELVYSKEEYTYELLPNGYSSDEYFAAIPWIKINTPDGAIVLGRRKRVFSIKWQNDYTDFNFNNVFKNEIREGITVWENKNGKGIHAWEIKDVSEYLRRVRQAVSSQK